MTHTILVFPYMEPDKIDSAKNFDVVVDQIRNGHKVPVEIDPACQLASDGCFKCEPKTGDCLRTKTKIVMTSITMAEVPESKCTPEELKQLKETGGYCKLVKEHFKGTIIPRGRGWVKAIIEFEDWVKANGWAVPDQRKAKDMMLSIREKTDGKPYEFDIERQEGEGKVYIPDFVSHGDGNPPIYKIHPDSGITQADIDAECAKCQHDYGNGISCGTWFNGKACTIVVLKDNVTVTKAVFDKVCQACKF